MWLKSVVCSGMLLLTENKVVKVKTKSIRQHAVMCLMMGH